MGEDQQIMSEAGSVDRNNESNGVEEKICNYSDQVIGEVSTEMITNLAKSIMQDEDNSLLNNSESSNFLGSNINTKKREEKSEISDKIIGNLLDVGSLSAKEVEMIKSEDMDIAEELLLQRVGSFNNDDTNKSSITILNSEHLESSNEIVDRASSSFRKHCICYMFLLFVISLQGTLLWSYKKENEALRKSDDEKNDLLWSLKKDVEVLRMKKSDNKKDVPCYTDSSVNQISNVFSFDDNPSETDNLGETDNSYNFESCWLNVQISYNLGDCASSFVERVVNKVSSMKDATERFIGETYDNLIIDESSNARQQSMQIISMNDTLLHRDDQSHSFSSLIYQAFVHPVKTTKDLISFCKFT